MITKFHTSRGELTAYALACGYIESYCFDDCTMRHRASMGAEHGVYHVKGFWRDSRFWNSFAKLSDARKFWRALHREALKGSCGIPPAGVEFVGNAA